jgi:hypothetical protein
MAGNITEEEVADAISQLNKDNSAEISNNDDNIIESPLGIQHTNDTIATVILQQQHQHYSNNHSDHAYRPYYTPHALPHLSPTDIMHANYQHPPMTTYQPLTDYIGQPSDYDQYKTTATNDNLISYSEATLTLSPAHSHTTLRQIVVKLSFKQIPILNHFWS